MKNLKLLLLILLIAVFSGCDQGEQYKEVTDHRITLDEYSTGSEYYLRIIQHVDDYDSWRTNFNQNQENWLKNGLSFEDAYQSSRDSNTVVIMMQVSNMDSALRFVNSPYLEKELKKAGTGSEAEVTFLKVEN